MPRFYQYTLRKFACALLAVTPLTGSITSTHALASQPAEMATATVASKALNENIDQLTFSNYDEVRVNHIDLDLNLDFDHKQVAGEAVLTLDWLTASNRLVLDTRQLHIDDVQIRLANANWQKAAFTLGSEHDVMGQALKIDIPAAVSDNQAINQVKIRYRASKDASGLQWLTPEQTLGKQKPFMFSQNQAIHARSWLPLQDTPSVRLTYNARIHAPVGITVLMSADRQVTTDTETKFVMTQAIPAYLIAIAAGDLRFAKLNDTTGIWAEPAALEPALHEFSDTPKMIDIAEKRYGAYQWGRYDLLILPPSFPFGGMENPKLSFITPTVIAGDKSLVSMIAHELAHSWSGNLVTNATWRDLWLNEGFTTYVENRIMEDLFGRERALMEQTISYGELLNELTTLEEQDTVLHLDLGQRDPDDAFSSVPYTKGQLLLMFLEHRFGRERFDIFVKDYFATFAFHSIDTDTFKAYLQQHLLDKYPNIVSKLEVNEWINGTQLPRFSYLPSTTAFDDVDKQRQHWLNGELSTQSLNTQGWVVHQWLRFINTIPAQNTHAFHQKLTELDQRFQLNQSSNSEIAFSWFTLTLRSQNYDNLSEIETYLTHIGRRRLVVPLYEILSDSEKSHWAEKVFNKARPGYHPLTVTSVEKLFKH